MLALTNKPLAQISPEDLEELVRLEVPEGLTIEFKRDLPGSSDKPDPWMSGEKRLGDRARRAIAREVVGFANAQGGWLLLGVEESDDDPKRAAGLHPIPDAADFAARIEQSLGDAIDPPVRGVASHAVLVGAAGKGVVVIRVPPSASAPHRVALAGADKDAFIRRGARTAPMAMQEIQDMTLLAARSSARVEEGLEELRRAYRDLPWIPRALPAKEQGYRISAMPTRAKFSVDSIYKQEGLFSLHRGLFALMDWTNGQRQDLNGGARTWGLVPNPVPMLRGGRTTTHEKNHFAEFQVREDGRVNLVLRMNETHEHVTVIYQSWLVADFMSVAETALKVASLANDPGAEIVIEVEFMGRDYDNLSQEQGWRVTPDPVQMVPLPSASLRAACKLRPEERLPGYLFVDQATATAACAQFVNDVRNLCGLPSFSKFEIVSFY